MVFIGMCGRPSKSFDAVHHQAPSFGSRPCFLTAGYSRTRSKQLASYSLRKCINNYKLLMRIQYDNSHSLQLLIVGMEVQNISISNSNTGSIVDVFGSRKNRIEEKKCVSREKFPQQLW